jgi:hypothetical protein
MLQTGRLTGHGATTGSVWGILPTVHCSRPVGSLSMDPYAVLHTHTHTYTYTYGHENVGNLGLIVDGKVEIPCT